MTSRGHHSFLSAGLLQLLSRTGSLVVGAAVLTYAPAWGEDWRRLSALDLPGELAELRWSDNVLNYSAQATFGHTKVALRQGHAYLVEGAPGDLRIRKLVCTNQIGTESDCEIALRSTPKGAACSLHLNNIDAKIPCPIQLTFGSGERLIAEKKAQEDLARQRAEQAERRRHDAEAAAEQKRKSELNALALFMGSSTSINHPLGKWPYIGEGRNIERAKANAVAQCHKDFFLDEDSCVDEDFTVGPGQDGCIAIARTGSLTNEYAWSRNPSSQAVKDQVLTYCRDSFGKQCELLTTVCN